MVDHTERRCMDGNTMVGYRFAAPVFLRPTGVEGEWKGRREESTSSRVSNLFPWGPNPERKKEREREGRQRNRGKRRIYVFGEGQGNEGSDKCTGVVQLDATGGVKKRVSLSRLQFYKLIPPPARKINLFRLEWSVKDSRVKFCYFFFFLFLFFLLSQRSIRRKERENSPIYPIFTRLALEYIASVTM